MQIIDAHQHFWNYHPQKQSWISDDMRLIQKDFLPKDLQVVLEKNNVESCISVQVDQNIEETIFQIDCANQNDFICGVVGWVDLFENDSIDGELDFYKQHPIVKGFRHILQGGAKGLLLQKSFISNLNKLAKNNFTYDLLIHHQQLNEAIELLKKVPNLPLVLNHIAKPAIKSQNIEEWERQIKIIAKHQNLFCKISGLATEANWNLWNENELIPYLDIIVENFGTNRIMFGSDWPVCLVATSYERWLNFLKTYFSNFTENERTNFFYNNCQTFYQIN
jgi:L-fuconolactonase